MKIMTTIWTKVTMGEGAWLCCSIHFYPWFKFYFPLFKGMVMYDNGFNSRGNKI